jgi:hypothetical protein
MAAGTQGASDYFVWKVPGSAVSIYLHLDVVDRLLADVMRGLAALPKRGAEVGGILLGVIDHGHPAIVRVEDFEPVESQYKSGPSYLLSAEDRARFKSAWEQWQPDEARAIYAVGYYRGNTRDGFSLGPEDIELLEEFFPSPAHIALLVRPNSTKASIGGFFFRENGLFPSATALEFPFRRRELSAIEQPFPHPRREPAPQNDPQNDPPDDPPRQREPASARSSLRTAVWIPLSFVFLLFGVALGLMIALARGSGVPGRDSQDFSLGLSVTRSDDNLSVRWDRDAAAIHAAARGVLEIEDGSYTKSVDLDPAQLNNGSIIYRNSSGSVRFRLVVYPKARISVIETVDWKRP